MDLDVQKIVSRLVKNNQLIPVDDSLIVYRMKLTQTAGGIMLPENTDLRKHGYAVMGVAIAVGPGRFIEATGQRHPMDIKPGDQILFTVQAGLELGQVVRKELGEDIGFEEIRLLRGHDVICKVRSDE